MVNAKGIAIANVPQEDPVAKERIAQIKNIPAGRKAGKRKCDVQLIIKYAHSPGVQGDGLFLNAGYVALVFGNPFGLKLPVPIPGDIYLEFPILAFEGLRGMAIPFVGGDPISLLIFFITEGSVQFRLHEFPRDVFKTFLEKGIDIREAGNVVF